MSRQFSVDQYVITLKIQTSSENDDPSRWDWQALLDMNTYEYVSVEDLRHITRLTVDDEGEPV
jgi:hypothetical protein